MSNAYTRLRALLPPPALLFGKVLSHNEDDDTSLIELPLGVGAETYAPGVTVGQIIKARGRTVPVDQNAFVRNGVVETYAPSGTLTEVEVGIIASHPDGPEPLELTASPIVAPDGEVGTVYTSTSVVAAFTGGYPPLTFALAAGAVPGLALSADGLLEGTPTLDGTFAGLVAEATDSSGRSVAAAPFSVIVEPAPTSPPGGVNLLLGRFENSLVNAGTVGGSFSKAAVTASFSTDQVKYGTASMKLLATGYVELYDDDLYMAVGVEFSAQTWAYFSSTGTMPVNSQALSFAYALFNAVAFQYIDSATPGHVDLVFQPAAANLAVPKGAWHHLAVSVDATNTARFFVNGVLVRTVSVDSLRPTGNTAIQAYGPTNSVGDGALYLRDMAVFQNHVYTADFTPFGPL
jgi:hypothetical protein